MKIISSLVLFSLLAVSVACTQRTKEEKLVDAWITAVREQDAFNKASMAKRDAAIEYCKAQNKALGYKPGGALIGCVEAQKPVAPVAK